MISGSTFICMLTAFEGDACQTICAFCVTYFVMLRSHQQSGAFHHACVIWVPSLTSCDTSIVSSKTSPPQSAV